MEKTECTQNRCQGCFNYKPEKPWEVETWSGGAQVIGKVDGNIVTINFPNSGRHFAQNLVRLLNKYGKEL